MAHTLPYDNEDESLDNNAGDVPEKGEQQIEEILLGSEKSAAPCQSKEYHQIDDQLAKFKLPHINLINEYRHKHNEELPARLQKRYNALVLFLNNKGGRYVEYETVDDAVDRTMMEEALKPKKRKHEANPTPQPTPNKPAPNVQKKDPVTPMQPEKGVVKSKNIPQVACDSMYGDVAAPKPIQHANEVARTHHFRGFPAVKVAELAIADLENALILLERCAPGASSAFVERVRAKKHGALLKKSLDWFKNHDMYGHEITKKPVVIGLEADLDIGTATTVPPQKPHPRQPQHAATISQRPQIPYGPTPGSYQGLGPPTFRQPEGYPSHPSMHIPHPFAQQAAHFPLGFPPHYPYTAQPLYQSPQPSFTQEQPFAYAPFMNPRFTPN